jgi:hypothetical protein
VVLVVRRQGGPAVLVPALVIPLAAMTFGTWLVRGFDIAAGDHDLGFIAVHLVLAAVSMTLAGLSVVVVGGFPGRR